MKAAITSIKCFSVPGGQTGASLRRQPGSHMPKRHQLAPKEAPAAASTTAASPRLTAPHSAPVQIAIVPIVLDSDRAHGGTAAPRVLHIDHDLATAQALATLLMPEACVTHVPTLEAARRLLERELYSLVVLDPTLPDGDAASLLPLLARTPLLVYSARQPAWGDAVQAYLPKPWTLPRQLFTTISSMLGIASGISAGD